MPDMGMGLRGVPAMSLGGTGRSPLCSAWPPEVGTAPFAWAKADVCSPRGHLGPLQVQRFTLGSKMIAKIQALNALPAGERGPRGAAPAGCSAAGRRGLRSTLCALLPWQQTPERCGCGCTGAAWCQEAAAAGGAVENVPHGFPTREGVKGNAALLARCFVAPFPTRSTGTRGAAVEPSCPFPSFAEGGSPGAGAPSLPCSQRSTRRGTRTSPSPCEQQVSECHTPSEPVCCPPQPPALLPGGHAHIFMTIFPPGSQLGSWRKSKYHGLALTEASVGLGTAPRTHAAAWNAPREQQRYPQLAAGSLPPP